MEKKIKPTFQKGDIVVPIKNVDFRGNQVYRYDAEYVITEIRDEKNVLLSAKRGNHFYYWATLDIKNIKKVEE